MDSERYGDVAAELDEAVLEEGLASLAANRDRIYYDAAADADAAAQYYSAVDHAVDDDGHALRRLVDAHFDIGIGGRRRAEQANDEKCDCGNSCQRHDPASLGWHQDSG